MLGMVKDSRTTDLGVPKIHSGGGENNNSAIKKQNLVTAFGPVSMNKMTNLGLTIVIPGLWLP
jgi:hypothetical protein